MTMGSGAGQVETIARIYGLAILQLAEAQGDVDVLLRELEDLAYQVDKETVLRSFFTSPLVDASARTSALEKLFRGRRTDLLVDALQIMNKRGRLGVIGAVAKAYKRERERLRGRTEVHVRTAVPLNSKLRERLMEGLKRRTGGDVDLVETVDTSLLGGLVLRIGDRKLDASLATQLLRLRRALQERASREIQDRKAYLEGVRAA